MSSERDKNLMRFPRIYRSAEKNGLVYKSRIQISYAKVVEMQKRKAFEIADKMEKKDRKKRTIQLMEDSQKTINMMATTSMTEMVRRGPSPVIPDPTVIARSSALETDIGQILDLSKNTVSSYRQTF